jgi:hypothetical protein
MIVCFGVSRQYGSPAEKSRTPTPSFTSEYVEPKFGWNVRLSNSLGCNSCPRRFNTVEGFKDLFKKLHTFALSTDYATVSTCSKLFPSRGGRKSAGMFTCLVPSGCVWAERTLLTRESPMDVVDIIAELVVSERKPFASTSAWLVCWVCLSPWSAPNSSNEVHHSTYLSPCFPCLAVVRIIYL